MATCMYDMRKAGAYDVCACACVCLRGVRVGAAFVLRLRAYCVTYCIYIYIYMYVRLCDYTCVHACIHACVRAYSSLILVCSRTPPSPLRFVSLQPVILSFSINCMYVLYICTYILIYSHTTTTNYIYRSHYILLSYYNSTKNNKKKQKKRTNV